jgi:hypothetical protein
MASLHQANRLSHDGHRAYGARDPFKLAKKGLNFKKIGRLTNVEFKVAGLAYRYDDASLDGLRSLSSRLCKRCQVLCAVERGNSRRTP